MPEPSRLDPYTIRDLGLLSDRRTAALVTRHGHVVWYSPERFDHPALLTHLLDMERGGAWALHLPGAQPERRAYLGDSAVLETHLRTPDGPLTLTDFMPFGKGLSRGVCRILSAAPAELHLTLHATPDYGRREAHPQPTESPHAVILDGTRHLHGSHPLHVHGSEVRMTVPAGQPAWAFLSDEPQTQPDRVHRDRVHFDWEVVTRLREHTLLSWRDVTTHATYHGEYERAVQASLRALRMLTYHGSGGIIAAPTTSLPEVPGGTANWDYRYVWLRDAGMIVSALTRAGGDGREARAFLDFVCGYTPPEDGLPVAAFVTVEGQYAPPEQQLDLPGHRLPGGEGARPVQIGNGARDQLQLDAYANVLLAAKLIYERYGGREHWTLVERLAEYLTEHWHEDDYGIWEERTRRPYVAGKVVTAVALEYISQHTNDPAQRDRWRRAASDARAWVKRHGLTPDGAYAYIAGEDATDVTAALYPVWGYCDPDSPEMLRTIEALERHHCHDGLYWRTMHDADATREGAFLAGSFWVAQYWIMRDPHHARKVLERALACANDLGLLAEEHDPHTDLALGNFPQTFVHAALIGAVVDLNAALKQQEEEG